ncbi:MAG: Zn-dependent alcohol dehydrogenase [Shewanella psychromarinicola]|jgi:Zn-dependent alcohol dehydrogenase
MTTSKQLFTLISSDGQLEMSLKDVDVPAPKPHEVIVRIEVAPINLPICGLCLALQI